MTEFAALLLPSIALLLPDVKSLDLAGLLKVQLRDLEDSVKATNEEVREMRQALTVSLVQRQTLHQYFGVPTERGAAEAHQEGLIPVEELPE